MNKPKRTLFTTAVVIATMTATMMAPNFASAAQLSSDAKSATPKEVQQLIVVDYRAMQNSPAAMDLKDRVLPRAKAPRDRPQELRPQGRPGRRRPRLRRLPRCKG
ncbi:hypothetical protein RBB78_16050 [Tunturiibacter empetritectus]|uniref:hypothetical protein n=1 Tax=Tunturiibacter empetritectus TaxID=3069691 RepID=UPI003D9BD7F3